MSHPPDEAPGPHPRPLTAAALEALRAAVAVGGPDEPRQVRRPDTWLLRRCWQALVDHGDPAAAFAVLDLIGKKEPLALYRALPRLARRAARDGRLKAALDQRLRATRFTLHMTRHEPEPVWAEILLSLACAAAYLEDNHLALAYLERLDREPLIWSTVVAQERLRDLLAEIIGLVGLSPLVERLLSLAIDQYGPEGAHLIHLVSAHASRHLAAGRRPERSRALLQHCVEIVRTATLVTLEARRHAIPVLAMAGRVDEILDHLRIMATIQEARRESSALQEEESPWLVRQVRRPRANPDVDFRFYALKDAVDHLPLDQISEAQRHLLAETIAFHGMQSDGWTASAAIQTLLKLGAVEQALAVVAHLDPRDTTRSEAYRVLVEGLLDLGQVDQAMEQAHKGLAWAQTLPGRTAERQLLWGVVRAFLFHGHPVRALELLDTYRAPDLWTQIRRFLQDEPDEDRVREEVSRLHAALLLGRGSSDRATIHLTNVRRWAPRVWRGRLLAFFYLDVVLEALLHAGSDRLVWAFLPDLRQVLGELQGREVPARLEELSRKLIARLHELESRIEQEEQLAQEVEEARTALAQLLVGLWQDSAERGIWRTVYTLGGTLPLLIALEGSDAVVDIAQVTVAEGAQWGVTEPQPPEETAAQLPVAE